MKQNAYSYHLFQNSLKRIRLLESSASLYIGGLIVFGERPEKEIQIPFHALCMGN